MYTGSGAKAPKQLGTDVPDGRVPPGEGRVKFEVSEKLKESSQLVATVRWVLWFAH